MLLFAAALAFVACRCSLLVVVFALGCCGCWTLFVVCCLCASLAVLFVCWCVPVFVGVCVVVSGCSVLIVVPVLG